MPVATFRRGMPEAPRRGPDVADLLPLEQKEDICRSLLTEFGIASVHSRGHELIHACLIDPTHTRQASEPTASLNFENLGFRCLGCGAKGYLPWYIAEMRGCTVEDARLWLLGEAGLDGSVIDLDLLNRYIDALYKPKDGLPPIPTYPDSMLEPWALLHPYLTDPKAEGGRGIPESNIISMRCGYAEQYRIGRRPDGSWITSERITIPHFWKGTLVGWQSRRLDASDGTAKYLSSADFPKDQTIYNYDPRVVDRPVVVMEAMLSAVSKVHLGPHPESTFGANVTDVQVSLLSKHPRVVLFMDNDEAGWKAVEGTTEYWPSGQVKKHTPGLAEKLSPYGVVLVVENPWAADPADLDDEEYLRLVEAAVPFSVWSRPEVLYCYSCKGVAHDGRCA